MVTTLQKKSLAINHSEMSGVMKSTIYVFLFFLNGPGLSLSLKPLFGNYIIVLGEARVSHTVAVIMSGIFYICFKDVKRNSMNMLRS